MENINQIKDKVVLITGATSGIGEACAKKLVLQGAKLILCGRRLDRLRKLHSDFKKIFNVDSYYFSFDITKKEEVLNFYESLPEQYKNIDILINNAGLALGVDKMHEADFEDWEKMILTNINGLLYISRLVLPRMVKNNSGYIINIGSIAGHGVYPKGAVYCSTKHAIRALSQGLRIDLCGTKIKISLIEPGMVETEFSLVRNKGDHLAAKNTYKGLRPLSPEDIAETILYCVNSPAHVNIDEIIIMPLDQASLTMSNRTE